MDKNPEKNEAGLIESNISNFLPKEHEKYFQDVHNKHFVPETAVGSLFTEVKNMEELLNLVIEQRADGLSGDDRVKLAAMGVDPKSILSQCRYLLVKTKGEVGIVPAKDLPRNTKVYVERRKVGAPCTLFINSNKMAETDNATIIIGPNENPEKTTEEMIWTVHPGLPIRPASSDLWEEGKNDLTVEEVIKRFKSDNLGEPILNIKKIKEV